MANLLAVAGSKLFIGTAVASKGEVTLADFTAQEIYWKQIGGWTNAGASGDSQQIVTQSVIDEGRDRQAKGTRAGATVENQFIPMPNDEGQIAFREAIDSCNNYAFKIEWGAGCANSGVVTGAIGAPGTINWVGHALAAGAPVVFTGGTPPAPLVSGTTYYVSATGLTAASFSVSATPGGAGIELTTAGSGTITATAQPSGSTDLFYGLAVPGTKNGGDANTPQLRTWSVVQTSNVVEV